MSTRAALIALVDIPIYARITTYPDSQLGAASVLVRLLAALPVGAVLGGYLLRDASYAAVAAAGTVLAAAGFVWMTQWGRTSLDDWTATIPLVVCGLGFGLAIAPVNAALLGLDPGRGAWHRVRTACRRADGRHAGRHLGTDHARSAQVLRLVSGRAPAARRVRGPRRRATRTWTS